VGLHKDTQCSFQQKTLPKEGREISPPSIQNPDIFSLQIYFLNFFGQNNFPGKDFSKIPATQKKF
jgi:hypothetical protein